MNKAIAAAPRAFDLAHEALSIGASAVPAFTRRIDEIFLRALDIILSGTPAYPCILPKSALATTA